jgi:hypothetical protein
VRQSVALLRVGARAIYTNDLGAGWEHVDFVKKKKAEDLAPAFFSV